MNATIFDDTLPRPKLNTINIDPHVNEKMSFLMIVAQLIWFGLGLSLLYDITEMLLHWPHLVVVVLYAGLMISTPWMGPRVMVSLSLLSLPAILSGLYFAITAPLPGDSFFALWSQMTSTKTVEYLGWMLVMMGYYISSARSNIGTLVTGVGFLVGNGLVVYAGDYAAATQGSYILGLILLALCAKIASQTKLVCVSRHVSRVTKIPTKMMMLLAGICSYMLYDWYYQYLDGWALHASSICPPLIFIVLMKCFRLSGRIQDAPLHQDR